MERYYDKENDTQGCGLGGGGHVANLSDTVTVALICQTNSGQLKEKKKGKRRKECSQQNVKRTEPVTHQAG